MEKSMNEIFSTNLRNVLYLSGKTQADLARATKTTETSVSKWINGASVPRPAMVDRICLALNCKRSDLMIDKEKAVMLAPEDYLAEEMKDRPELYDLFNAILRMPSKDIELLSSIVRRLSL